MADQQAMMAEEEIGMAIELFRCVKYPPGVANLERQFIRYIYARAMEEDPEEITKAERQKLRSLYMQYIGRMREPRRRGIC